MLKLLWLLLFGWGCRHDWKDKECVKNSNGLVHVQECTKCHNIKSHTSPTPPCHHIWRNKDQLRAGNVWSNADHTIIFVDKCEKCGELKETRIKSYA